MKSFAFMFWGYLVVWLGLAAYLFRLGSRLSTLAARIAALETRLERGRGAPNP